MNQKWDLNEKNLNLSIWKDVSILDFYVSLLLLNINECEGKFVLIVLNGGGDGGKNQVCFV